MKNNKKAIYYLITGAVLLILFVGGITFAYFSSGVTLDSKNISVITDSTYSFSANVSKDLSLHADKANMTNASVGWSTTDIAEITVHLDGAVGLSCSYDVVLKKEGDRYEKDPLKNGSGLTVWGDTSSSGNAYGIIIKYPTEAEYGDLERKIVNGKITVVSGSSSEYTINVNLKWTNLNTDQLANGGTTLLSKAQKSELISDANEITDIHIVDTDIHLILEGTTNVSYGTNVFGWMENETELYIGESGGVSAGSNLSYAFYLSGGKPKLQNIYFDAFDTSNTTNMYGMFQNLQNLIYLDVSNFDTSNVTNMGSMFFNLKKIINLDLSSFDTSKVTNMARMVSSMNNVKSLDLSGFDTSNVTYMSYMFSHMYNLSNLDISNFNTTKVTSMEQMFLNTYNLKILDMSSFDTSNVKDFSNMFNGSKKLTDLYLGQNWIMIENARIIDMFKDCCNFININIYNAPQSFKDKTSSLWSGWYKTPNYIP